MIDNMFPRDELIGFSRRQSKSFLRKTVRLGELDEALADNWEIQRHNKASVSLIRPKLRSALLESRVWTLFYRMGFPSLSGEGGAQLLISPTDPKSPKQQLDVVALDREVALAIECKSFVKLRKDGSFSEKIAKLAAARRRFQSAVSKSFKSKGHVATVMFTWDVDLKENDWKRAKAEDVVLFDLQDLEYFEALVNHLGPAARYLFLAEAFRGRKIAGCKSRCQLSVRAWGSTYVTPFLSGRTTCSKWRTSPIGRRGKRSISMHIREC